MGLRCLVMGDNHGDTESLRRVLDDVGEEPFDVAIHVGDFTRAWRESRQRDDEDAGRAIGVEQLREVEPLLAEIDSRARHGLLWVYGNQDYFGDLDYDLDVGTEVPDDDTVEVGGVQFTSSPAQVESDVVLVSHLETWSLVDHFEGLAHFCGNSHRGRHRDRRLNSAFLHYLDPETGDPIYGGYFVAELPEPDAEAAGPADSLDVELRSIGTLERLECDRHRERGVQFQPAERGCMYCNDRRTLLRELSASAFYGLTEADGRGPEHERPPVRSDAATGEVPDPETSVTDEELVEHAVGLWDDPPEGFREDFASYLADVEDDRYAPLTRTGDGCLALADRRYAY